MESTMASGERAPCSSEGAKARFSSPTPIILLHGFAQSGATWNEIAERLQAQGHVTYAPDLANLTETHSLKEVCGQVMSLARTVTQTHGAPPVLVGYSMGGRIVLEALAQAVILGMSVVEDGADQPAASSRIWRANACAEESESERQALKARFLENLPVAGVVIESAGLGPADERARINLEQRNQRWAHEVRELGVEAFMGKWEALPLFASQQNLPESARARLRAERTANAPEALACMFEKWGQHRQGYEEETLAALACTCTCDIPVCYVVGEVDEKYRAVSRLVAEAVPEVRVVVVPDAGHNVHAEKPEGFLEAIRVVFQA